MFHTALRRDPIFLVREMVRSIRSARKQHESFQELIRDGNKKEWFKAKVPPLQLLRDVRTRWDSVYFMIQWARVLQDVSFYYFTNGSSLITIQALDYFFSLPLHQDIVTLKLSRVEWKVLQDLEFVLKVRGDNLFQCYQSWLIIDPSWCSNGPRRRGNTNA